MAEWKTPRNDYTAGSQVTPDIFNTLGENERYLQEVKIVIDQVQDAFIKSTEAQVRDNITAIESIKDGFGKVRKWFSDLRTLAFKSTVATADINALAVTSAKIASNAVTVDKADFTQITEYDDDKVEKFVERVTINNNVVTFTFINGAEISREYTNGPSGNQKGWRDKQRERLEKENKTEVQ